jgi:16S rRNA (cytosine1402-N4)-methyltransferase
MSPNEPAHRPVFVAETLSFLHPKDGGDYADCSCGHGYFAERLAQCTGPTGRLLCLDIDADAVAATARRLARFGKRCRVVRGSYVDLPAIAPANGFGKLAGIVIDAGCTSREQLMNPALGLSFRVDGELNMKLDPSAPGPTARELIATLSGRELAAMFRGAGESTRTARVIASAIEQSRARAPLTRTTELAQVVENAVDAAGLRRGARHPATRVFLSLRNAVNQELPTLEEGIHAAVASLRVGGRLCVLTYFGTEHALVRQTCRALEGRCTCPPGLPVCACGRESIIRRIVRDPLSPSAREVDANESARSARLHVVERTNASM